MKKKLLLLLYVVLSLYVHAQTLIGNQKVDRFPVNVWNDSTYGLTWLPTSYASNPGKRYPLIIFLHGTGGAGSGVSGLNNLISEALPKRIADGFQPSAVNPKNGQTYEFIVVSPQSSSWSYNYNHVKYILPNVLSKYRVDSSRIYLTGLSAGGDGVFTCVANGDSNFIKRIAAAATSSSAGVDAVNGLTAAQVEGQLRYATKRYGVQCWNVVGYGEAFKDLNVRYHDSLNIDNPVPRDKLTIINGVGHSTWNQQYDSAFRPIKNVYANNLACNNGCPNQVAPNNNGSPVRGTGSTQDSLNVYEWFLLWSRTAPPPTGTPTGGAYPPCGSRHRYQIVPNADTAFWCYRGGNPDVTTFQPGDTLAFAANHAKGNYWTYIYLDNFKGNPSCPLVMINEGGQTRVKGSTVTISNSSYVKFTGSGAAGIPYGWLLTGKNPALRTQGPFSIVVNNRSKNIEIDSVSIHNTGIGIQIQTNGSCADSLNYPNWVLDSMFIHDNRIVGIWNEGMYIGNTSPDNASYSPRPVTCNGQVTYPIPMKSGYTKIWNNYVDSTGRGGIQLANAEKGVSEIYNNTVKHNGLNGDQAQGTAISIGLYTHAYIHDNTISNTYTFGIASIGACGTNIPVRIENNSIDSTGYLRTYDLSTTSRQSIDPATEPSFPDTLTWPFPIWVDTRQRVYTTDNPAGTAIHGQDSTQFWIKNNVIGRFICYTSTRDNQSAIQIEDHALGLQSSGNIICNNTSSIGQNIAIYTGKAGHPVAYSTNCGAPSGSNSMAAQTSAVLLDSVASSRSGPVSVSVYPSPVPGNSVTITAQNETSGKVIVSVIDMSGKLVQHKTYYKDSRSFQQQLYLQGLPKGIYLLKIQFNGKAKPDLFKLVKM